MTNEYIGFVV